MVGEISASRRRSRLLWVLGLPTVVTVIHVAGSLGASQGQPEREPLDALGVALLVVSGLALAGLRSRPVAVLGLVVGVTLAYLLLGYPYGPGILGFVVAVVGNVLTGHRLAGWLGAVVLYAGHFAIRYAFDLDDASLGQMLGVAAWFLLLLVVAEIVRVRRERVADAQRSRLEQQRRREADERVRIARELHDVVAHHMSLINVQAGVGLHLLERDPEQARTALVTIKDSSKEALVELRSLVGVLRQQDDAAPRQPVQGLAGLDDLVARTRQAGVDVEKVVHGTPPEVPTGTDVAAFRIVQEALTNVVRHAEATRATVRVGYGADGLRVQVDDDGKGLANTALDWEGTGITGMRERTAALGGTLTAGPRSEGGFRVSAWFPLGADG